MKIVFYSHAPNIQHGANKVLVETVTHLSENHECLVVFPLNGKGAEVLRARGIQVKVKLNFWLSSKSRFSFASPVASVIKLLYVILNYFGNLIFFRSHVSFVSAFKPDIIYTNTSIPGMGIKVAQKLNIPHLWHLREFQYLDHNLYPDFGWKHYMKILNESDVIIANSESLKRFYSQWIPEERIKVVYNGIIPPDNVNLESVPGKNLRFLMVGGLLKNKGHKMALDAVRNLLEKYPEIKLEIVGKGYYKKELEDYTSKNGLEQFVKFMGSHEDVSSFYRNAGCMLMCSYNEAFGRVTVEAMMHGLPVIGYNNDFCATGEIIRDGIDGLLFTDPVNELADKMEWMMNNPEKAALMGKAGKERALKEFSFERYIQEIEEELVELKKRS